MPQKLRWSYTEARKHVKIIVDARRKRAQKTCAQAGLDPTLLGIHPNNAMCAYKAGKPWANVDYSLVRKTLWLLRHMWDAQRILDRYSAKRTAEDRSWITSGQGKFA